jgi:hypothetical protein
MTSPFGSDETGARARARRREQTSTRLALGRFGQFSDPVEQCAVRIGPTLSRAFESIG